MLYVPKQTDIHLANVIIAKFKSMTPTHYYGEIFLAVIQSTTNYQYLIDSFQHLCSHHFFLYWLPSMLPNTLLHGKITIFAFSTIKIVFSNLGLCNGS